MEAACDQSPTKPPKAGEAAETRGQSIERPGTSLARLAIVAEWLVVALGALYLGAHTLPHAWSQLNTDFPNYYLTAHLVRHRDDASRVYEWIWFQRQKDHLGLDQRIVGMVPITPFSTLVLWPLSFLPPLVAKHWWLILNLGMLAAALILLERMSRLPWRRILLIALLCFPLHVNLLLGQYYVLLLLVLTLACWLYLRQRQFSAGAMIGLGFGLKLFPILFLLYFLRKKSWRAFAGGVAGGLAAAAVSVAAFGWALNRTYVTQVLPWALRGEGMDPYNLAASSISSLMHRLFIYEPQRNPHPALNAPWMLAVFHPLLQALIFAPALLLAMPGDSRPRQLRLEWAAILLASLAISTSPASYDFTLLILPVCFLWEALDGRPLLVSLLLFLYLAIGWPMRIEQIPTGWLALLGTPRLYEVLLLCIFCYVLLVRSRKKEKMMARWIWSSAIACGLLLSIALGLRHQYGLYEDYQWRLAAPQEMMMAAYPVVAGDSVLFTAMLADGYHTGEDRNGAVHFHSNRTDELATSFGGRWTEEAGQESQIVSMSSRAPEIRNGEQPVVSPDGRLMAFLREDHGLARLWRRPLHSPANQATGTDEPAVGAGFNVLEMSFLPDNRLIFAAISRRGAPPDLFLADRAGHVSLLVHGAARYPAVSPDGQWLAYSRLQRGNWHLWIRNLRTGESRRITSADCNSEEPAWEPDSKTLVYASDCGRALWFTALCRRPVLRAR